MEFRLQFEKSTDNELIIITMPDHGEESGILFLEYFNNPFRITYDAVLYMEFPVDFWQYYDMFYYGFAKISELNQKMKEVLSFYSVIY